MQKKVQEIEKTMDEHASKFEAVLDQLQSHLNKYFSEEDRRVIDHYKTQIEKHHQEIELLKKQNNQAEIKRRMQEKKLSLQNKKRELIKTATNYTKYFQEYKRKLKKYEQRLEEVNQDLKFINDQIIFALKKNLSLRQTIEKSVVEDDLSFPDSAPPSLVIDMQEQRDNRRALIKESKLKRLTTQVDILERRLMNPKLELAPLEVIFMNIYEAIKRQKKDRPLTEIDRRRIFEAFLAQQQAKKWLFGVIYQTGQVQSSFEATQCD